MNTAMVTNAGRAISQVPTTEALGKHIYIYNNIRTNQVVYSLSRTLQNKESIRQLPFLGKKSVPSALRKDLWQSFALVSFPIPFQGLQAYRKLREFRTMHEYCWDPEDFRVDAHHMMSKKKRGRKLMNQKANTVADLAAVLKLQAKDGREAEKLVAAQKAYEVEMTQADPRKESQARWVEEQLRRPIPELPASIKAMLDAAENARIASSPTKVLLPTTSAMTITSSDEPFLSLAPSAPSTTPSNPITPLDSLSKNARRKLKLRAAATNSPPPRFFPAVLSERRRRSILKEYQSAVRKRAHALRILDHASNKLNLRFLPIDQARKLLQQRLSAMDNQHATKRASLLAAQQAEITTHEDRLRDDLAALSNPNAPSESAPSSSSSSSSSSSTSTTAATTSTNPIPALQALNLTYDPDIDSDTPPEDILRAHALKTRTALDAAQEQVLRLFEARYQTDRNKAFHHGRAQIHAAERAERKVRNLSPGGVSGVVVRWRDVLDAEYAASWPKDVVHEVLDRWGVLEASSEAEMAMERSEDWSGKNRKRGGKYEFLNEEQRQDMHEEMAGGQEVAVGV